MRSYKEQLDLIMQKKGVADRKRKRNRRILFSTVALVLCLSVTLSFALIGIKTKNREDCVIGEEPPVTGHDKPNSSVKDEYDYLYSNTENADGVISGSNEMIETEEAGEIIEGDCADDKMDILLSDRDAMLSGSESNKTPSAGTLSGGEIKDNDDYSAWIKTIENEGWEAVDLIWKLPTIKRITVKTEGCAGAVVQLLDAQGKALYGAVTNAEGVAYLFVDNQAQIKTVAVIAGGKSATQSYNGIEYSFDMEKQGAPQKLDLMFVVDTTGSMGDELEYLKAEIADVINRISEKDISVRTSVNFYRDEGDEYVVKYHGFNTDSQGVQLIVTEQRADGGGDYEEAVHTALHNAVYEHAWEKDSVKVMFLVLDAPPHQRDADIATFSKAVKDAAAMGIRIVPVASSGVNKLTEGLLRAVALTTGGTYTFLTDHSGVGDTHLPPSTESYDVEPLNDMLVRIALEYCGINTEKTQYTQSYDDTQSTEYVQ